MTRGTGSTLKTKQTMPASNAIEQFKSIGYEQKLQEIIEAQAAKIAELHAELAYQKQLAAMSDLTLGISHELGQPITNIRYTIQFYSKMLEETVSKELVISIFNSILTETERMGELIKRLSPLTSRKNTIEQFDIVQRIKNRFDAEKSKIQQYHIQTTIAPLQPVYIEGAPIHFEQIINNLLLNAMDAIAQKRKEKPHIPAENTINVHINEKNNEVEIDFSDTGTGIDKNHSKKLFEPFFTTKQPEQGEGLGLFIVWNLLKGMGGEISLDLQYTAGARFKIIIPKKITMP